MSSCTYLFTVYDVHDEHKTYAEAKQACISLGGKLVEPKTAQQNARVTEIAKANGIATLWMGIQDQTNEDEFIYESSGQTITYSNWYPNEPNDWEKREDCAEMYVTNVGIPGKWNDDECSTKMPFACESNEGNR